MISIVASRQLSVKQVPGRPTGWAWVSIHSRFPALTVVVAVPLAEPDVAVIVAVPFATEVTRPTDDTVATAASDVVHVTVAPLIVSPLASVTVAVS
jgi:hypothetical protein